MQSVAKDVTRSVVCVSVCSRGRSKTAEPIRYRLGWVIKELCVRWIGFNIERIHLQLQSVTSRRCGLLPNHLDTFLLICGKEFEVL